MKLVVARARRRYAAAEAATGSASSVRAAARSDLADAGSGGSSPSWTRKPSFSWRGAQRTGDGRRSKGGEVRGERAMEERRGESGGEARRGEFQGGAGRGAAVRVEIGRAHV